MGWLRKNQGWEHGTVINMYERLVTLHNVLRGDVSLQRDNHGRFYGCSTETCIFVLKRDSISPKPNLAAIR